MTHANMAANDAARQPIVTIKEGEVFATSRDVAAFFQKRHADVLRDIRELIAREPDLGQRNFALFKNNDLTGETTSHYDMDRRGFTVLAMGFTGAAALKWKLLYIDAFDAMEAELRNRRAEPAAIDVRDPSQLAKIAMQLIEVNKELEERVTFAEKAVEVAKPKAEFFDRFADAEGLFGLQNAARVLGRNPNKFINELKREHLFYQGNELVPKVRYDGLFKVKSVLVDGKSRHRTYITPKGLQHFAAKMGCLPTLFSPGTLSLAAGHPHTAGGM